MPEIGLFDAIYSARALRRLKPDPVPEEIITRILDAAIRAPSAGNAQNWAFVVVRDSEQRRRLGMIYRKASDIASEMYKAPAAGASDGRAISADADFRGLFVGPHGGSAGATGPLRARASRAGA
jgi:nitroreductase